MIRIAIGMFCGVYLATRSVHQSLMAAAYCCLLIMLFDRTQQFYQRHRSHFNGSKNIDDGSTDQNQ